jgi:hypothetical protein
MKIYLTLVILLFVQTTFSREEMQLGVILGAPTGISAKLSLGNNRAIDMAFANSLDKNLGLELTADYLIDKARSYQIDAPSPLDLYFGIGARISIVEHGAHNGKLSIGPRTPIGVSYNFTNPNLQIFSELALILDVIPYSNIDLEGALGARYRF